MEVNRRKDYEMTSNGNIIEDFMRLVGGEITEEEYNELHPSKYKMTEQDIKEIQSDADKDRFY